MTAEKDLLQSLQPDIARRFLRRYIGDASTDEAVKLAGEAIARGDANLVDDFRRAVIALESTLDRELPERALVAMVEGDANTSLDDPTDDGARAWLETVVAELRAALGTAAPATSRQPRPVAGGSSSPARVAELVDNALAMTDERLGPMPAGVARNMLSSIRNQLEFMRRTIAAGAATTVAERNSLTLGVIAVREFETADLAYCDAICDAVAAFGALHQDLCP